MPQIVHLFAMKRVPWTQALETMYLTSLLTIEVFIAMVAGAKTQAATLEDTQVADGLYQHNSLEVLLSVSVPVSQPR